MAPWVQETRSCSPARRGTIRSRVVHTGGWLSGWLVLISLIAFRSVDGARETFDIALTRQQGEASARSDGDPYDWDGLGL